MLLTCTAYSYHVTINFHSILKMRKESFYFLPPSSFLFSIPFHSLSSCGALSYINLNISAGEKRMGKKDVARFLKRGFGIVRSVFSFSFPRR